jgi:hypothetical protein
MQLSKSAGPTAPTNAGLAAPTDIPGGADRDRTDDIQLAKLALSQLSYGPIPSQAACSWWAWVDSNYRPHAYQACALTS